MSKVYYTSDLHFGHKLVSELRGFDTPEEHDYHIADTWNKIITKRDVVYVLGDLSLRGGTYALDIVESLPGRKHFISGNHDMIHPMHERGQSRKEMDKWLNVFESVQPFLRRKLAGQAVLLSHFPYASFGDGERGGSRYDEYRMTDVGLPLLHGHTHGKETMHDNMLHVGWDAWGTFVQQDIVIDWINTLR